MPATAAEERLRRDFDLLSLEGVTKRFGGLVAVKPFDLELRHGELVGLIGPNGAGKTTIFNLLTGVYPVTDGKIRFEGKRLDGLKPSDIVQRGVARTFQNIRLFPELTVIDNVKVAYNLHCRYGLLAAALRTPAFRRDEARIEAKARDFLAIFGLEGRAGALARNLPYGEQRRLEIARALATEPKLLLLDEPAAGTNPLETQDLMRLVTRVRKDFDLTILLIEHDMKFVMEICERIVVLDHGQAIARGAPDEIRRDPEVIRAYLGASGTGGKGLARPEGLEGDAAPPDAA